MVGDALAGIAKAYDFSMRAGIVIDDVSIHAAADHFVIYHQHRTNRHFSVIALSATRQFKRLTHPAQIVFVEFRCGSHEK